MDKYKTIYLDIASHKKSSLNPIVNGDDLARVIEATYNDMDAMGYELDRIFDKDNLGGSTVYIEGMILLFKRIETPT